MELNFSVEGLKDLENMFVKTGEDLGFRKARTFVNPGLSKSLRVILPDIKANTPVATGGLAQTIGF